MKKLLLIFFISSMFLFGCTEEVNVDITEDVIFDTDSFLGSPVDNCTYVYNMTENFSLIFESVDNNIKWNLYYTDDNKNMNGVRYD